MGVWDDAIAAASKVCDRYADRVMRRAQKEHDEGNYEVYEAMESEATVVNDLAETIRALKRPSKPKRK